MTPEEKEIKRLRYYEGLGCYGILICTLMLIGVPLIVFSTCSPLRCEPGDLRFLAFHMGGSVCFLIFFELLRRFGAAALKKRGR